MGFPWCKNHSLFSTYLQVNYCCLALYRFCFLIVFLSLSNVLVNNIYM